MALFENWIDIWEREYVTDTLVVPERESVFISALSEFVLDFENVGVTEPVNVLLLGFCDLEPVLDLFAEFVKLRDVSPVRVTEPENSEELE